MIIRETTSPPFLSDYDRTLPLIAYNNVITAENIFTTSEDQNFPATNVANPATHLKWKVRSNSTATEAIYFGIPENPTSPPTQGTFDYIAVAGHNFGSLGCTVIAGIWNNDSPPTATEIVSFAPADDAPFIFQFEARQAAVGGLGVTYNLAGVREAAVIYAGNILTLERGVRADTTHTPINLGRIATAYNGFSESGNFLGRILKNNVNESRAEFMHFTASWYRNNFDPFVSHTQMHPFFFALDPHNNPQDTGFAWITKPIIPEFNPATGRFNATIEMRGIG